MWGSECVLPKLGSAPAGIAASCPLRCTPLTAFQRFSLETCSSLREVRVSAISSQACELRRALATLAPLCALARLIFCLFLSSCFFLPFDHGPYTLNAALDLAMADRSSHSKVTLSWRQPRGKSQVNRPQMLPPGGSIRMGVD